MSWYGIKMDTKSALLAANKGSVSLSKEDFDEMKEEIKRRRHAAHLRKFVGVEFGNIGVPH